MRKRMSLLTALSVAVIGTFSIGMPGAQALDPKCMYPPSKPSLSIGLNTTAPTAGSAVYVRGKLSLNKCGLAGTPILIRGGKKVITTRATDGSGSYSYRYTPTVNGSFAANATVNKITIGSRVLNIAVRTNLRGTKVAPVSGCRATVRGSIFPARKGAILQVQSRVTKGKKFVGWKSVGKARTDAKGNYSTTVTLPCGSKSGVSVFITPTKINAGNRTATSNVTVKK
jgi:hypothetical protein